MSKERRRAKAIRRQAIVRRAMQRNSTKRFLCLNCGNPGPHFVPPSMGDEGFYICERRSDVDRNEILRQWGWVR